MRGGGALVSRSSVSKCTQYTLVSTILHVNNVLSHNNIRSCTTFKTKMLQ